MVCIKACTRKGDSEEHFAHSLLFFHSLDEEIFEIGKNGLLEIQYGEAAIGTTLLVIKYFGLNHRCSRRFKPAEACQTPPFCIYRF